MSEAVVSEAVALFNGDQGQLKSILPSNVPVVFEIGQCANSSPSISSP